MKCGMNVIYVNTHQLAAYWFDIIISKWRPWRPLCCHLVNINEASARQWPRSASSWSTVQFILVIFSAHLTEFPTRLILSRMCIVMYENFLIFILWREFYFFVEAELLCFSETHSFGFSLSGICYGSLFFVEFSSVSIDWLEIWFALELSFVLFFVFLLVKTVIVFLIIQLLLSCVWDSVLLSLCITFLTVVLLLVVHCCFNCHVCSLAFILKVKRSRHLYTVTYREIRAAAVYSSKWCTDQH